MKVFLEQAIFKNRAPFRDATFQFVENEIAVLTAVNGGGKTTVISHIVDAFYEMARPYFSAEFEGKENKYYRVSSLVFNLNPADASLAYLRFRVGSETVDYVDVSGSCTSEQYNAAISLPGKIQFGEFSAQLDIAGSAKQISSNLDRGKALEIFGRNLLTYFPAYRYESPGYLNDVYKVAASFQKENDYSGMLKNPIEVPSGLSDLINWVMDVVLDMRAKSEPASARIFDKLNDVIARTLSGKNLPNIRFGLGHRSTGGTRLQIGSADYTGNFKTVYPSIFNLSAGELSIFCLFGEIIRQADRIDTISSFSNVTGIVLIDEIDKHLHIRLQHDVLPRLLDLFPNVQFLVSSHSPFFAMGLAKANVGRAKIVSLDNQGVSRDPTANALYEEVYNLMLDENQRFLAQYKVIQLSIAEELRPLIITEGKTDWKYFLAALRYFQERGEFLGIESEWFLRFGSKEDVEKSVCGTAHVLEMGGPALSTYLDALTVTREKEKSLAKPLRIGIFDSDDKAIKLVPESKNIFKVFSFKIIPDAISTEFLFSERELMSEIEGRRLYIGTEFDKRSKRHLGDSDKSLGGDAQNINKAGKRVVIESDIYNARSENVALSKELFAAAVFDRRVAISAESWENFRHVFQEIERISGIAAA